MTAYIEHTTTEGERWDTLAYRYYGDPARISPLAEANEHLRLNPILAGGLPVRVPILDRPATLPPEGLPPWKR